MQWKTFSFQNNNNGHLLSFAEQIYVAIELFMIFLWNSGFRLQNQFFHHGDYKNEIFSFAIYLFFFHFPLVKREDNLYWWIVWLWSMNNEGNKWTKVTHFEIGDFNMKHKLSSLLKHFPQNEKKLNRRQKNNSHC